MPEQPTYRVTRGHARTGQLEQFICLRPGYQGAACGYVALSEIQLQNHMVMIHGDGILIRETESSTD